MSEMLKDRKWAWVYSISSFSPSITCKGRKCGVKYIRQPSKFGEFFQIHVLDFNKVATFIWKLCNKVFLRTRQDSQGFTSFKLFNLYNNSRGRYNYKMKEENKTGRGKVIYLRCHSPEVAEPVLLTIAFISGKIAAAD